MHGPSKYLPLLPAPFRNPDLASHHSPPAHAPAPQLAVSDDASLLPRTLSSPALTVSMLPLALPCFIHNIYTIVFVLLCFAHDLIYLKF